MYKKNKNQKKKAGESCLSKWEYESSIKFTKDYIRV